LVIHTFFNERIEKKELNFIPNHSGTACQILRILLCYGSLTGSKASHYGNLQKEGFWVSNSFINKVLILLKTGQKEVFLRKKNFYAILKSLSLDCTDCKSII